MNPTIHSARCAVRAAGGSLIYLGRRREYPPSGRAYWRRLYRLEMPGRAPQVIDDYTARWLQETDPDIGECDEA